MLADNIQPYISYISPFDATIGTNVYYTYTGSQQSVGNNLRIMEKDTGLAVYDFEYSTYEKVHPIPYNALENGKTYVATLRVKFVDGTYSPYSPEVDFKTLATPVLDIINIDGQGYVYNTDVTFIAKYSQENGEQVKTYKFTLYDEHEELLESFPYRVPDANNPNTFTETVKGLQKGKGYFIECQIETVNGLVWSTREKFIPLYIVPSINGVIYTSNDSDEGFVRVTSYLRQITGTSIKATQKEEMTVDDDISSGSSLPPVYKTLNPYDYQFLDNDWVVIPEDNPIIFKGLAMNRASDFVMKLWCKDIPDNTIFLELSPADEKGIVIKFLKLPDRIVAEKELNGIKARYCSNIVTIPSGTEYMVYVKNIEHRMDINITLL